MKSCGREIDRWQAVRRATCRRAAADDVRRMYESILRCAFVFMSAQKQAKARLLTQAKPNDCRVLIRKDT